MLDTALNEFDVAIAAIIAYDEVHDPDRVALVRKLFQAQRGIHAAHGRDMAALTRDMAALTRAMADNTSAVHGIAERVQGHIQRELLNMVTSLEKTNAEQEKAAAAQEQANAQHVVMLQRLGAQDAMLKATHDRMIEIAQMLRRRASLPPREADTYE